MSSTNLILIGMNVGALLVIGVAWAASEVADYIYKGPKDE